MRFVLIALIVIYLALAFIGCLDRQMAVHRANGKELNEDHQKINCGRSNGSGGSGFGVECSRLAASRVAAVGIGD